MSYLPAGMPVPEPSPEDGPYWDACRAHRLVVRRCDACERCFHPPMPSCPHCGSLRVGWREVSGGGTVFSYTVAHHPVHKALQGRGAYNIVVVMLDGADDVRLVSNLVDTEPADLRIGLPVTVCWEEVGNGMVVPRFRRADAAKEAAV